MIQFNTRDINMLKIQELSKLCELKSKLNYRFFGLKTHDEHGDQNSLIHFLYYEYSLNDKQCERIELVRNLLTNNRLSVTADSFVDDGNCMRIGLRRDLRDNIEVASKFCKTIVYGIEGILKFKETDSLMLNIPIEFVTENI